MPGIWGNGRHARQPNSERGIGILLAYVQFHQYGDKIDNWPYDRMGNPDFHYVWPEVTYRKDVWVEATFRVSPCPVAGPECEIPVADCYGEALAHHMIAQIMAGDNDSSNYGYEATEKAVTAFAIEFPAYGQVRVSN